MPETGPLGILLGSTLTLCTDPSAKFTCPRAKSTWARVVARASLFAPPYLTPAPSPLLSLIPSSTCHCHAWQPCSDPLNLWYGTGQFKRNMCLRCPLYRLIWSFLYALILQKVLKLYAWWLTQSHYIMIADQDQYIFFSTTRCHFLFYFFLIIYIFTRTKCAGKILIHYWFFKFWNEMALFFTHVVSDIIYIEQIKCTMFTCICF